jgi:hypothetical protein
MKKNNSKFKNFFNFFKKYDRINPGTTRLFFLLVVVTLGLLSSVVLAGRDNSSGKTDPSNDGSQGLNGIGIAKPFNGRLQTPVVPTVLPTPTPEMGNSSTNLFNQTRDQANVSSSGCADCDLPPGYCQCIPHPIGSTGCFTFEYSPCPPTPTVTPCAYNCASAAAWAAASAMVRCCVFRNCGFKCAAEASVAAALAYAQCRAEHCP